MDGPLIAATTAALTGVDRTTHLANIFLHDVTSSQEDLEPVLVELFGLGGGLQQLQAAAVPAELQPPLTSVVRDCSINCSRIDAVLSGCGDGTSRSGRWALTDAPVEIGQLKTSLEVSRRALEIVVEALDLYDKSPACRSTRLLTPARQNSEHTAEDIDDLRQDLVTVGLSPNGGLVGHCLDALERYITEHGDVGDSDDPSPSEPATPSILEMMKTFRNSSLEFAGPTELESYSVAEPKHRSTLRVSATSSPEKEEDENVFGGVNSEAKDARSPPTMRLDSSHLVRQSRPLQYALFPPPSPAPSKALPPVPPPRSHLRPIPIAPKSPLSPPNIPARSRARTNSDVTRDSKVSGFSSDLGRFSSSTLASSVQPFPRSSSYVCGSTYGGPVTDTVSEELPISFDLVPLRRLQHEDKDAAHGGVYFIDDSPGCTILASRHGKFHIKLWDLPGGPVFTDIKVQFYVQVQARSREFFIRSHVILSETHNLIAIATGFGQTLEIWNWARKKKVQTINNAVRWAAVRADVYDESRWSPLATYREDEDAIYLHPVSPASSKKPFGKARVIELRKAGLGHIPKFPELAYSSTSPILVAAAGPRPPRPNIPPPAHAALLIAWQLDGDARPHTPYKYLRTGPDHPELEHALPLCLATYGSVVVSVWEPAKFRTIGRPGLWQVEPLAVAGRVVLVWDFSGVVDKVTTYRIPDVLVCVSPDCRLVAYCDPGGGGGGARGGDGALVVLDANREGRELWRLDGVGKNEAGAGGRASRRSWRSVETKKSGRSSSKSDETGSGLTLGGGGLDLLAASLHKVTDLAFSGDGKKLFIGDVDGGIGVYEVFETRDGIGMAM